MPALLFRNVEEEGLCVSGSWSPEDYQHKIRNSTLAADSRPLTPPEKNDDMSSQEAGTKAERLAEGDDENPGSRQTEENNLPSPEETLAEARRMVSEVDHGNVGVQWEDPPEVNPKVVPEIEKRGSGNVGVQWEEPPSESWEEKANIVAPPPATFAQGLRVERGFNAGAIGKQESESRNANGDVGLQWDDPPEYVWKTAQGLFPRLLTPGDVPQQRLGNVGVQWEEPRDEELSAPKTGHCLASPRGTAQASDLSDAPSSAPLNLGHIADESDLSGLMGSKTDDLPEGMQWDPVNETFVLTPGPHHALDISQTGDSDQVGAGTEKGRVELSRHVHTQSFQEKQPEEHDMSALMGSKSGDLPEGMEWDPVNETFTQRKVAPESPDRKISESVGENDAEISVRETAPNPVMEASSIYKEVESSDVSAPADETDISAATGGGTVKSGASGRDKGGERPISQGDSLNESQKGKGLLKRLKRRIGRAK